MHRFMQYSICCMYKKEAPILDYLYHRSAYVDHGVVRESF